MKTISHKFVELIPEQIENGIIYISLKYCTAIHKCCCGCQEEVVTPLSPTDWKLVFDGKSISLYPSIGNWNFHCKSHYWIKNNIIEWAPKWSREKINTGRNHDYLKKKNYYNDITSSNYHGVDKTNKEVKDDKLEASNNFWLWLKRFLPSK